MTIPPEELRHNQEELARKLAAAYIAHALRVKSIDRVFKTYDLESGPLGEEWMELARHAEMIHHQLGIPKLTKRKQ